MNVSSESIICFFNSLNCEKIKYILIRNIGSELPYSLETGKDIDLLVKSSERDKMIRFLENNYFKKIRHPNQHNIFLYGIKKPEMFTHENGLMVDIEYQLTCRSLNAGEVIPLGQKIQKSAWNHRKLVEAGGITSYRLDINDEFVMLITRAVFDKKEFPEAYANEIEKILKKINFDVVEEKLALIFFKFTPILLEQVKKGSYKRIRENYLAFKDY